MKRIFLVLSLVCLTLLGWAEPITREQALRQAQQFCSQNGKGGSLEVAETAMSRARRRSLQVPDYYYVFNVGQEQGYVIVSGDDRTAPILGFSNHGSFDVDKVPCNMAAWLQDYADQIKYLQEHPEALGVTRGDVPTHPDISNMITTKWNQTSPYNDLLPTYNGQKCLTGCGATALAQIMNYHGAPANCPAIPGYTTETYKITCENLPATTFNWGNMGSNAEVAKLMKYCAYALQADLGPDGTSAYDNMVVEALKTNFGYGNGVQMAYRGYYQDADWDMLIYNELANSRPIILIGQSPTRGGHFFILHGYSAIGGLGYYSVNWGWGGYEDGQFLLSAMDPKSYGAGNGFNNNQAAIVGISTSDVSPYQVEETVVLTTDEFGLTEGEKEYTIPTGYSQYGPVSLNYKISNHLTRSYNFEFNFKVYKDGEFLEMLWSASSIVNGFGPGYWYGGTLSTYLPTWDGVSLGQAFATPGTYKIVPVSREAGSSEWIENVNSDKLFITGVVSSDKKLKMYNGNPEGIDPTPDPKPEVSQAELDELAGLYAAQKSTVNEKITAIASNDAKLSAITQTLSQKNTAIQSVKNKISEIENKLKNEYLTASQKTTYNNELNALKTKLNTLVSDYNAANQELTSLQASSASLKSTLNSLLNSINTEAAKVSSITTAAALNASKTKVAEITSQQSGCNVATETAKIAALESDVAKISVTQIETGLTTLESNVDAAIAAAIQAEQDEKDKEAKDKLEAAKQELLTTYANLEYEWSDKLQAVNNNETTIASLEAALKDAKDAIAPVEKNIAAIRESLNNDMLSAAVKSDFENTLKNLEKAKSDYANALNALANQLATVKNANDQLKSELESIDRIIRQRKTEVNELTVTSDLNAAKTASQDVAKRLNNVNVTNVEKELQSVTANLSTLSLTDVTKDLAALEDDIAKAVAQSEEDYEKQQAEKLAKAKEECQAAINSLDEKTETFKSYYDVLKEAQGQLEAKMVEIEGVVASMKKQYSDIEKMLDELIAKQTTTDGSEVIAALQKKLKALEENLAELEDQCSLISGQIDTLDGQKQKFATVIETATNAIDQSQNSLSSAATIADVESLTASVTKAANTLSSDGMAAYNLYVDNYGIVINNLNVLIDNLNYVYKQANSLEADVEYETTSIQHVAVDESEVLGRYDLKGNRVDSTYKGVQIIRLKNGKTIKINVK